MESHKAGVSLILQLIYPQPKLHQKFKATDGFEGKLTFEKEIKCHGDMFHELFRHKPQDITSITPYHVHKCNVLEGKFGTIGSTFDCEYTHEGKKKSMKVVLDEINEEKKLVKYKAIGGEILERYKVFSTSVHVDTDRDDHVLKWTLEYEKVKEDVPDPVSLMELAINVSNDIEAHHAN